MTSQSTLVALWFVAGSLSIASADPPIVIAHRGASGYLPEHTLAAKTLAIAQGADFIEQDVVLSRDGVPVVMHDIHLDTTTNVREVYPERNRKDGRYYAIDFSFEELKRLRVVERFNRRNGQQVFPGRFAGTSVGFRIVSLAEEIELLQGLNRTLNKQVGLYIELKAPAWHRSENQDLASRVLRVLEEFGLANAKEGVYLQCFEAAEIQRLHSQLKCKLPLIQLMGHRDAVKLDDKELNAIAEVARGIGPPISAVLSTVENSSGGLVKRAHRAGLLVHPYTLRKDDLPEHVPFRVC